MRKPLTHSAGFTIIELMVAISVLAVLLGLGVPAFNDMIRNTRIANQANAVVGALTYARGETATRGMPVSICAASSPERTACVVASANTTDWANGWIIFTDRAGTAGEIDVNSTDELLQAGDSPVMGFTLSGSGSFVRFGVGASPSTNRTLTITPTDTNYCASTGTREITVSNTGRVNTAKDSC